MRYPHWLDFDAQQVIYGVGAPACGIGVYTLDRKFSWPDMEYCTQTELEDWREWLTRRGYEIPDGYKQPAPQEKCQ